MNKRITLAVLALVTCALSYADKEVYIPQEWRSPRSYFGRDSLIWAESDPNNQYTWSLSRSKETDNVVIFWDNGYGSTSPSNAASRYKVDIDDLAEKCEAFYQLECDELGFVDPYTSNLSKYKVMVLLHHTTDWICSGSGYDYQISALWLSPSACQPVGSSVAHEVGHSFHYMCYCVDSDYGTISGVQTGFHGAVGNGSTIWETTANWQALQSYPSEMFTESGFYYIYNNTHNYALTHEWHRYQAYMFFYFLCDYYNDIRTIADVWNYHETTVKDFNEVLMDLKGLSVSDLYKLHFEYALKAATWDLDVWAPYRSRYIGNFNYYCVREGEASYQVAYASAPQSTGFNIIPLQVPAAGTEISTEFTALSSGAALLDGDPALFFNGDSRWESSGLTAYNATTAIREFRLGYVALLKDGTREYFVEDTVYCHGKGKSTATVGMTVPANTDQLWLVVCPSPTTYIQHRWDENIKNDDQWPYSFKLTGTDLASSATVYDSYMIGDRGVADISIEYKMNMPVMTTTDASSFSISDDALYMLGTAFQLTKSEMASRIQDYSEDGPDVGKIMVYPYSSSGDLNDEPSGVEGGYGYWYSVRSVKVDADDSRAALCVEFDPDAFGFKVSQVPGILSVGNSIVSRIALRYRYSEDVEAIARFQITVNINYSSAGLSGEPTITYDEEKALPVEMVREDDLAPWTGKYYDLSGRQVANPSRSGIYIMDGKKVMVK